MPTASAETTARHAQEAHAAVAAWTREKQARVAARGARDRGRRGRGLRLGRDGCLSATAAPRRHRRQAGRGDGEPVRPADAPAAHLRRVRGGGAADRRRRGPAHRRDRHAPDEQLHGPLPDRAARRARHHLPRPQLALRRQRHGAADGARPAGPGRGRQVHARSARLRARRPGRQLGRRRARRLLPGRGRALHGETMVDGDPSHIVAADLPPVDGIALCAAHEGRSHLLLRWIDPSVVDEHDGLSVDPALDMYDPANWADGAAAPPRFEPEFLARFMAAQRARRDRIEARVRERLAALRATPGAPRDEAFIVYRTHADPRCLDLALDANDRRPGSVWGDARAVNYSANAMGRTTSLTAFLSQWSSASRAGGPENLAKTSVPALLLTYSADQSTFPSTRDAWLGAGGGRIRNVDIVGGDHYLAGRPDADEIARVADEIAAFAAGAVRSRDGGAPKPGSSRRRTSCRAGRSSRRPTSRARAQAPSGRHRRRRPGRPDARLRPRAARRPRSCCSTRTTPSACAARRRAASAMRRRASRSSTASASTSGSAPRGITWSVGRTFSGADEVYSFNLKDESFSEQPPFINLQQFYLEWFLVERIRELAPEAIRWKSRVTAVENNADGGRRRGRDAGRHVRARGRLVHRRDRRQQPDPRRARPRGAPLAPHRPLVHQRRPLQEAVRGRALDLDRRAVQRGPRRLAAPDGRRRLAPRLPDGRGRRPGVDQPARGRRRAPARAARPRRRVRVRLDRPVPVPRPPARDLPRRPHALHRRRRARRLPVRRARRQQRHPGRGQPRLEAGAGAAGPGARARSSTAITTSATPPRPRTCASRAGPRASSRRAAPPSTACAAPSSRSRAATSSRAGSPTPGAWRRPTPIRRRRGRRTARARCRTSPSMARR